MPVDSELAVLLLLPRASARRPSSPCIAVPIPGILVLRSFHRQNPYEMRKKAIMQFIDTHTMAYVGLKRKDEIESIAREIMNTGIKFKDACHVASAITDSISDFPVLGQIMGQSRTAFPV